MIDTIFELWSLKPTGFEKFIDILDFHSIIDAFVTIRV